MIDNFNFDDTLELQIIKNILANRSFLISIIDHVRPEFFSNKAAQVCCTVTKKFFKTFSDVPSLNIIKVEARDILTPADDMDLFESNLADLDNLEPANEEYLKGKILEFCKTQALILAIRHSIDYLKDKRYDKIEEEVKDALLITEDTHLGLAYFEDVRDRFIDEMKYKKKIKTGVVTLDKVTAGGWTLQDTTLAIIVAPTGVGKSLLLCKFGATAVLAGHKVMHITHELSEQRTAGRYDSIFTKVTQSERLDRHVEIVNKLNEIKTLCNGNLIIKEFPTRTCSTTMLQAYLNKMKERGFQPDLIINDYLDIMATNTGISADDSYTVQKCISEELRALAQICECPIITASQTNRAASDKEVIKGTDVAESYAKTFVADLIITVNQSDNDKLIGKLKLYIAKYRNGISGIVIPMSVNYEMMTVEDFSEAEDNQSGNG